MRYLDLRCKRGFDNSCGAAVVLVKSQVLDPTTDGWAPNNETWSIECHEGHILSTSDDLYEDDEHPLDPTVLWAQQTICGILDFTRKTDGR